MARPKAFAKSVKARIYCSTSKKILDRGLDALVCTTGCLKACEKGPVMVVQPANAWYSEVDEECIDAVLDGMEDGEMPSEKRFTWALSPAFLRPQEPHGQPQVNQPPPPTAAEWYSRPASMLNHANLPSREIAVAPSARSIPHSALDGYSSNTKGCGRYSIAFMKPRNGRGYSTIMWCNVISSMRRAQQTPADERTQSP